MNDDQMHQLLHDVLGLSPEDIARRHNDRLAFLNRMCTAYDCNVPFQNLSTTCVPFTERKHPSLQEAIDAVLRRQGGLCWTLNSVMVLLLQGLGFDVNPIIGSVAFEERNNHIMILVRNVVNEGDVYLIDVGFGRPAHPLVPLEFDTVSEIYNVSFTTLRFVKKGDLFIRQSLIHPKHGPRYPTTDGAWENVIYFQPEAKTLSEIDEYLTQNMYDLQSSVFNITRRITGMSKNLGKFIAIVNNKLLVEGDDRELQKTMLTDDDAVVDAVAKYFPYLSEELVRQSYKVWHDSDEKLMKTETYI